MGWRWVSLILILVLLAGCGSPSIISDPKKVQTLQDRDKTVITFWHTYNDKETQLLEQRLIPAFEQENSNIRVETINLAFNNELKNTLIARASSNRGPDVVRIDIAWVPEFSLKGLLEPLNGFTDFEDIRNRFNPKAMDVGFYKNEYYSLPLNIYTKAAIFNRELLEQAGYSKPPSTMKEVLEIARQHRFTIGLGGLEPWNTIPYLYSLGGTLTDKKFHKASGYLNGEGTIHAVEQLTALYKEKLIDLPKKAGDGKNLERVKAGNTLLTDDGPWFYSLLNKTELDRTLKRTIPVSFPHGNGSASIIGGENMVIMKGSKHPDEAWTFMKWMTGKEAQLIMAQTGLIPTNLEAAKAFKVTPNSYLNPFMEPAENSFQWPPVKNWSKIDKVYTDYLNRIFAGELSVKDGLDRAAAEIDVLLADSDSNQ
ncbi:extracellular solute-binding protein [Mesobacillus zeae]|nr:extracellular solute-binding protein [Mesobacillus zeae]